MTGDLVDMGGSGGDSPFEKIKPVTDAGNEYWSSRDFAQVLGYTAYRKKKRKQIGEGE